MQKTICVPCRFAAIAAVVTGLLSRAVVFKPGRTPETPYEPAAAGHATQPDFLSRDTIERLRNGPLRWHLVLTVAAPGDRTDDATLQWPVNREEIDAGTLVIEHADAQGDGACRDVNFDPTILPEGIRPSDDLLLAARSAAYSVSFNRRTREEATGAAHLAQTTEGARP
jgi:catalase